MKCYNCGHLLPDDSEFCQYCGKRMEQIENVTTKVKPEQIDINLNDEKDTLSIFENNADNDNVKKSERSTKKVYCRICGGIIDKETKKCSGCGKQYFRGIRLKTILNSVFGTIILVSLFFNIMQYTSYVELVDEKYSIVSEKNVLEEEVKKLKENVPVEYDKGYDDGYSSGYSEGYSEGKSQSTIVTRPNITYSYDVDDDECCLIPGCIRSPQINSFYCFSHECMDVGCHNQRSNDFCSYCVNHKCAVPNCNSSQAFNSVYCYRHK